MLATGSSRGAHGIDNEGGNLICFGLRGLLGVGDPGVGDESPLINEDESGGAGAPCIS